MILSVILSTLSLIIKPPVNITGSIRRYVLIFLVLWQLKKEMDGNLTTKIKLKDMTGSICLITGANSGIGLGISEQLLALNCHVVMACRSKDKCDDAALTLKQQDTILSKKAGNAKRLSKPKVFYNGTGLITTMTLDLADLESVREFTYQFKKKFQRLDVLVNNAGLIATKGYSLNHHHHYYCYYYHNHHYYYDNHYNSERTMQGLETSIGVMHVGHFALTKWLMDLLLKPINNNNDNSKEPSRVINIASAAYIAGAFHSSLLSLNGFGDFKGEHVDNCGWTGPFSLIPCCPAFRCPNTNGYYYYYHHHHH